MTRYSRFKRRRPLAALRRKLVKVLRKRKDRPVHSLHFRIGGLDDVIFIGSVSTAAMPETEMPRRQFQRFAREDIAWIRTGVPRPHHGVDSGAFSDCDLRFN